MKLCERLMKEFCEVASNWRTLVEKKNLRSYVVVPWEEDDEIGRRQHVLNQYAIPSFIDGRDPDMKLQFVVKGKDLHARCTLCLSNISTGVSDGREPWSIKDLSRVGNIRQHAITTKHQKCVLSYMRGKRDAMRHFSCFQSRVDEKNAPIGMPIKIAPTPNIVLENAYNQVVAEIAWREALLATSWHDEDVLCYTKENEVTPSTRTNLSEFTPRRDTNAKVDNTTVPPKDHGHLK